MVDLPHLYAHPSLRTWSIAKKPRLPFALKRLSDVVKRTLGRISEDLAPNSVSVLHFGNSFRDYDI